MREGTSEVRVTKYDSSKGEICAIKFLPEIAESKFRGFDHVKFDFVSDRLYFVFTNDKSGLKINHVGLVQVTKSSTVNILKCFEGSYSIEYDTARDQYFIDFNHRSENKYNSNYGDGNTGYGPKQSSSHESKESKDYTNATLDDISEEVKAFVYPKFGDTPPKEPENKPYAIVKKREVKPEPNNIGMVSMLLNLAINQLDSGETDLASSTLVTIRELIKEVKCQTV